SLDVAALFCFVCRRPPSPTLSPYTPLFRSSGPSAPAATEEPASTSPAPPGPAPSIPAARRDTPQRRRRRRRDALLFGALIAPNLDRKSTRLNSSHVKISYAVFCS